MGGWKLQIKQIKNLEIEDLLNRPTIKLEEGHVQKYLAGKKNINYGGGRFNRRRHSETTGGNTCGTAHFMRQQRNRIV